MISWHKQAIAFVPENDAMYGRMTRMLADLEHRLDTYDQFRINPYQTHTVLPKFNSDIELELGEYNGDKY